MPSPAVLNGECGLILRRGLPLCDERPIPPLLFDLLEPAERSFRLVLHERSRMLLFDSPV